jgi:capsule polysaccharide export protein KpsE/RkpR
LAAGATDDTTRRRLLTRIGTARASEDVTTLKCVLAGRDSLATLTAILPLRIVNLANGEFDEYKALIDKISAREGELFLYALLTPRKSGPG